MKEYRIDLKVRNNVILYKLEKASYNSIGEACRLNDKMKYVSSLGDVINMKRSPLNSNGEFLPSLYWLAELVGCAPIDLFTDVQLNTILKTNKREIQVNEAEMRFLTQQNQQVKLLEDIIQDEQKSQTIKNVLNKITPREKKVLEMTNGLGEYTREYTLKEIAQELECSPARAAQIKERALGKLRNPRHSSILRSVMGEI